MELNIRVKFLNIFVFCLLSQLMAYGIWPVALYAQDSVGTSTASYNEVPEEIVIKSEGEDKIRTPKPPLKIITDDFESIKKSLETDKDMFLFESGEFLSFSRNYPEKLASIRVIQPWRAGFSDKNVIVFYPRRKFTEAFNEDYIKKNSKNLKWALSVTDEEGKVFLKYSGTGLPPESINWTGENDQREWFKAGHNYAPIYVFVDAAGSPTTVIGDIIKFPAIVFQKDRNLNISLDSVVVFGPTKSLKVVDKVQGEALLAATCDLIKRRYFNIPVKINVYAQTKDLAGLQAGLIKDFFKKELMPSGNIISSEGFEESFSQQRVDVVLLGK